MLAYPQNPVDHVQRDGERQRPAEVGAVHGREHCARDEEEVSVVENLEGAPPYWLDGEKAEQPEAAAGCEPPHSNPAGELIPTWLPGLVDVANKQKQQKVKGEQKNPPDTMRIMWRGITMSTDVRATMRWNLTNASSSKTEFV